MATLSANSRRNSAATSQNSPRPSITGCMITNLKSQMQSLNEEEDLTDMIETKLNTIDESNTGVKIKNKVLCSERSDSGFSECSNCSGPSNIVHCNCFKTNSNADTNCENKITLPHDILQSKLEKIAEYQCGNEEKTLSTESSKSLSDNSNSLTPRTEEFSSDDNKSKDETIEINLKSNHLTTGTIAMRKKSLENSFIKDSNSIKINTDKKLSEKYGKVSLLKEKFSTLERQNEKKLNNSVTIPRSPLITRRTGLKNDSIIESKGNKTNCMDVKNLNTNSNSNLSLNNTNNTKTNSNSSLANSRNKFEGSSSAPSSPGFSPRTAIRLSGRVKEVTERLSAPKTNPSIRQHSSTSSSSSSSSTIKTNGNIKDKINFPKTVDNSKESFKKISAFWER